MQNKRLIVLSSLLALGTLSISLTSCNLQGPQGEQGTQGEQGPKGDRGDSGKDGSQIYTGQGSPVDSVKGKNGDIYIDTDTGDMYCYSDLGWVKTGNIKGNDGKDGNDGKNGKDGQDGVSVLGISKTSSENGIDTYTITYSDGHTDNFTVTNGKDGTTGAQGVPGKDGHTPTITIGVNGNWYVDGVDTGYKAQGETGATGAQGEKGDKGRYGSRHRVCCLSRDRWDV